MTVRQQILDSRDLFMNLNEFASAHTIKFAGQTFTDVPVVWDDDRLTESADQIGTYPAERVMHIKTEHLNNQRPAAKAPLQIDGKPWRVVACVENFGMYELRLETGRG